MTTSMILKTGQSFSIYGVALSTDSKKLDLTGFEITAVLKGKNNQLDLTPVKLPGQGSFRLDGTLSDEPVGEYKMDVKFHNGNIIDYSQTVDITLQEPVSP